MPNSKLPERGLMGEQSFSLDLPFPLSIKVFEGQGDWMLKTDAPIVASNQLGPRTSLVS